MIYIATKDKHSPPAMFVSTRRRLALKWARSFEELEERPMACPVLLLIPLAALSAGPRQVRHAHEQETGLIGTDVR